MNRNLFSSFEFNIYDSSKLSIKPDTNAIVGKVFKIRGKKCFIFFRNATYNKNIFKNTIFSSYQLIIFKENIKILFFF